jgi:VWFA-related protein
LSRSKFEMSDSIKNRKLLRLTSVVCLLISALVTPAQTEPPAQDDVVRVFTQLVQTDLMVFDRRGHLVSGLKREDFELKVDGKATPIEFLDYVVAGSAREEAQLASARSGRGAAVSVPVNALERGRTVLFYVDDLHLDPTSCDAARKMIAKFLDRNMAYNTNAAITSTSGQIGFLQQLTDSDLMLRAALRRLNPKPYSVEDGSLPRMTEHQAWLLDRRDPELTNYFIDETIRMARGMTRDLAGAMVSQRAGNTLFRAGQATRNTLAGLENLLAYANKTPGRKLLIFISGGFVLDLQNTREAEIVHRISSEAARSGVVIYSVDARGLTTSTRDASSGGGSDPMQRLERSMRSEVWDTQDVMNALAQDTGGKTVFNTNDLTSGLQDALQETSVYYLVGWKPDPQTTARGKFQKLTASIIGRPDLTVRIRRGFAAGDPPPTRAKTKEPKTPPPTGPEAELQKAMLAPLPGKNTPVSIALNYANTAEKGLTLSTSLQIDREFVSTDSEDEKAKQNGTLEVVGTIYDDHGRAGARISDRLSITAPAENDGGPANAIVATYPIRIQPGLFQVRVAVRNPKTGRVANTNAWVEVPDLLAPKLALSSLMIGERKQAGAMRRIAKSDIAEGVNLNVKLRFAQGSQLRFLVFAYNAKSNPGTAVPDVAIQVQIIRNGQPVVSPSLRSIVTNGGADLKRLPYAAELSLEGLERGHYQLRVTAFDRVANTTASELRSFEIE